MRHLDVATAAERLYAALSRRLGGNGSSQDGCGWYEPGALDAVALPLPGAPDASALELWLGPDARPGDLPRRLRFAGTDMVLRVGRRERPHVQAATASSANNRAMFGTVTGLVRDRLHPERFYVLGCGHVFAGSPVVKKGDAIDVTHGGTTVETCLVDWEPTLGAQALRTGIDAAIAEVTDLGLQAALRNPSLLPAGVSSNFIFERPVKVQAPRVTRGTLKTRWSGYVDVAGTANPRDYFLQDAIGYQANPPTSPGDSGAAVWDDKTDKLFGLHVAAPVGDERWRSNAILCPIDRVMEWFDIEPVTHGGGVASLPATAATAHRPTMVSVSRGQPYDIDTVAKTLWGEARGEGEEGMRAVACVIGNRKRLTWRGKSDYTGVCRDRYQFSCWNESDPNRARLEAVDRNPDAAFQQAMVVARALVAGDIADFTFGATHYFADSLKTRPYWARGKVHCYRLGRHLFFNNVQ